eukprot:8791291-Alexandrium_andersonii.AAC.1
MQLELPAVLVRASWVGQGLLLAGASLTPRLCAPREMPAGEAAEPYLRASGHARNNRGRGQKPGGVRVRLRSRAQRWRSAEVSSPRVGGAS